MRTKTHKILIATGSFMVLMAALYLGRGWIRGTFVPAYVEFFYKPRVEKNYDTSFDTINQKLSISGFSFHNMDMLQDECWKDKSRLYHGFSETVTCIKYYSSDDNVQLTESFSKQWEKSAPELENFLLVSGWHKESNANQQIAQIYDNPNFGSSKSLEYSKIMHKTRCELSIGYTPSSQLGKAHVYESCIRDVEFFGGY